MALVVACHGALHLPWLLGVDDPPMGYVPGARAVVLFVVVQYGQVGVCVFLTVSGYFLSARGFSWRRAASTWARMLVYSLLCLAGGSCLAGMGLAPARVGELFAPGVLPRTLATALLPFLSGAYWFVSAYLVMLAVSPFLNVLLACVPRRGVEGLLLMLGFLSVWRLWAPAVDSWSMVSYALLCYLAGGWVRRYGAVLSRRRLPLACVAVAATLLMGVFDRVAMGSGPLARLLGWGAQVKPGVVVLPVVVAVVLVMLAVGADGSRVPARAAGVVSRLGSAMFGVYLLHENQFGYRLVWPAAARLVPAVPGPVGTMARSVAAVLLVFAACTLAALLVDRLLADRAARLAGRLAVLCFGKLVSAL